MFTLRPATQQDAPFLSALEQRLMEGHARALWGGFLPAEISAFDLSNTRILTIGAFTVGYVTLERAEDHWRLKKIYLVPEHQGRGLGKALLARVRGEAAQAGMPLRLSVLRPNTRALAFYLREGMVPVDETADRIFLEYPHRMSRSA